jgi:hypothetical protein
MKGDIINERLLMEARENVVNKKSSDGCELLVTFSMRYKRIRLIYS